MNSMTGYATVSSESAGQLLNLELRSVNSRYLEIHFRVDDAFRATEPALRERIQQCILRGKVECRIALTATAAAIAVPQLNWALLDQMTLLAEQIGQRIKPVAPLSVAELLRWPGMLLLQQQQPDLQAPCLVLLDQALLALQVSRQREGEKMAEYIIARLDQMQQQITQLQPHLPQLIAAYQRKLQQRFHEFFATVDDERIGQELALFAQKIDVDEELSRLQVHMQAVRDIVRQTGASGKQLDFLMQELNREANTLGSKSVSVETTQVAMALKVLIEQIREQVQNIE